MPGNKRSMLQSRLQKRLRRLNMASFEDYHSYVFSQVGRERELHHLLDVVTTNKTDFFREPRHYDVLVNTALPEITRRTGAGLRLPLAIWSAGCSTGAEPYTLAMVLNDYRLRVERFHFRILATDICTRVLQVGRQAIYDERDSQPIPYAVRKRYLLRSKDQRHPRIRIVPELRRLVEFRRLNLMDRDYRMADSKDIVLCRNVIIYFDRPTQQQVLGRICRCLRAGGYLFMGHSETLNGFELPLNQITATVYQKKG